jgi:TonB-linked SusC/RagA family outer membrane protein
MKKTLLVLVVCLLVSLCANQAVWAQGRTISGRVTSAGDGTPLPGVNVVLKGTSQGAVSDAQGSYSLEIPQEGNTILVFSFIGLVTQEIEVGTRTSLDVEMVHDVKQLTEVVVTAIGIERQKREIGYAVQTVQGGAVSQKSEPNLLNSLNGKLSGVEIISSSGAPGSGTQVFIRGLSSATGNNQPLFIVDGIPIDNTTNFTSNPTVGGNAYSNRALDINPNDVESINVLKGPAAAALYGSRAGNGAIIITTKKGKGVDNMEITVNSSVNFQQVNGLPKYQNQYGQGVNFRYNSGSTDSWGPKFGTPGLTLVPSVAGAPADFDTLAYRAYPDNVKDVFNIGSIYDNGISLSNGNDKTRYIFSINSTNQKGTIPNTSLDRYNFRVAGNTKLKHGFSIDASIMFINTKQRGTPQGNSGSSPWFTLPFTPRSFDLASYPYKDTIPGVQLPSLFSGATRDNPLWSVNQNFYTAEVNRSITSAAFHYQPSWLKDLELTYRIGYDQYTDNRLEAIAFGSINANGNTASNRKGSQIYDYNTYAQLNHDIFAIYKKNLTENIGLRLTAGEQITQIQTNNLNINAQDLIVPEFYNLANHTSATSTNTNTDTKRRLVGVYGQAGLSYKDWLFLEVQGRNDWSSTLPVGKNSFFYPAVSLGWVFTDALQISNSVLSYGKLRANYASVGTDANTYLTNTVFITATYGNNVSGLTFPFGGSTASNTRSNRKGNNLLEPEFSTNYEIGTELGLLDGKISLDINGFFKTTTNQIYNATVPGSTGFTSFTQNAGRIDNKGLELAVDYKVISNEKFSWNTNLNFTLIRNEVVRISPGVTQFNLLAGNGLAAFGGLGPMLKEGRPFGVLQGTRFLRNDEGKFVINPATGLPIVDQNVVEIGNPNPDWWGNLNNTLTYKNFSLNFIFSMTYGGDFYSRQTQIARLRGALEEQVDRERPYMYEGVLAAADGTASTTPNNVSITASDYWIALNNAAEWGTFEATNIRLREITLGYSFNKTVLSKTPFTAANISLSGRNLFFYAPFLRHTDPETNQLGSNTRGFEFNSPPAVRNYGINLSVTF